MISLRRVARFVLFHLVCVVLGFDAFLVKVRLAYRTLNAEPFTLYNGFATTIFLVQMVGIVRVLDFVHHRICKLIFAGEDGVMDDKEMSRMEVWSAMFAQKVYRKFSLTKFLVIMVSFSDADFQRLMLNERGRNKGDDSLQRAADLVAQL